MNNLIFSHELIQLNPAHILGNLPLCILIKNNSFQFVAANQKACELTGFKTPNDMIGLTDAELNCPAAELYEEIQQQDRSVLEGSDQFFLDIGYYADTEDLKILYTSKRKMIDEKSHTHLIISTTILPITTINNVLFNLIHSANKKYEVHSYQLKNEMGHHKLTNKQAECLFYLLRGKSNKEIAHILKRSPRTIEDHIALLRDKFNCLNKSQLIEKAFQMGFAQVLPPSLIA
jgi:DNA-binding CsgD family transcriptional regulator